MPLAETAFSRQCTQHTSLSPQKSKSVSSSRSASGSSSPSNSGRRKKSPGAVKRKVMFDSTEPAEEGAAQENLNNLLLSPKCTYCTFVSNFCLFVVLLPCIYCIITSQFRVWSVGC